MATPPRSQSREPAARSMSSRTLAVTAVVLALGGFIVYKGLGKPSQLKVGGTTETTAKAGTKTTPTTLAPGATPATTAPSIVATAAPVINAKVDVLVANAAEIQGIAGEVSTALTKKGYKVLLPATNASPVDASAVYFNAGNDKLAAIVAKDLGIATVAAMPPTPPVKELRSAQVLVMLGKSFKKAEIPAENALAATGGAPAAPAPAPAGTPVPVGGAITAATTPAKPAPAVTAPAAAATTAKKP